MDARTNREKCENNEQKCDLCEQAILDIATTTQDDDILPENDISTIDILEFTQQEAKKRDLRLDFQENQAKQALDPTVLLEYLQKYRNICPLCSKKHNLQDCSSIQAPTVRDYRDSSLEFSQYKLKLEPYSGCFKCGLPQLYCPRFRAKGDGGFERTNREYCNFPYLLQDFLASTTTIYWEDSRLYFQERAIRYNLSIDRREDLVRILGRRVKINGLETNEITRFFWVKGPEYID